MGIGGRLKELRAAHLPKLTQDELAARSGLTSDTVRRIEQGTRNPSLEAIYALAAGLGVHASSLLEGRGAAPRPALFDDEYDALDLVQRVASSDVGEETLRRLESAVDELARAYPVTPPRELVHRVRTTLGYITRLVDAKMTLDEHQRLLTVGSWLSLLAGTLHIDLGNAYAARARLQTSLDLADQVGNNNILAWCLETRAYGALTNGDYQTALSLSTAARDVAPKGSSIAVQATAQEGRALARLGRVRETYAALERVAELVNPLDMPAHPEHHFVYDPNKAPSYFATTLAWLGDRAAEDYAREVIARLSGVNGWPRRVASARLDLGLILLTAGQYDEAASVAREALESGRVVPSNQWRVQEVVEAAERRGLPEARELREAYRALES